MPLPSIGRTGIVLLAIAFALPTGAWAQQHFTECLQNNVNDANVVVPISVPVTHSDGTYTLEQGDEVAIVSNDGRCAGMATVDTSAAALSVAVANVDSTAGVVEGYESDELLKYRIWRRKTGEVAEVSSVTYECDVLSLCTSGAQFKKNGVYEIAEMSTASSALPVELASFEATRQERTIVLNWRTESESNNSGFEVQHKPTSGEWSTLSFVEGAGTTDETQNYRYKTKKLHLGTHHFRLKHVHKNGTKRTSRSVKVKLGLSKSHVISEVAPNPVRTSGRIKISLKESQHVTVHLYDVLGRRQGTLIHRELGANQTETVRVDADRLPSGKYFLRIKGEEFQTHREITIVK